MVRPVSIPEGDSIVSLVLCKTFWLNRHVYLGPQYTPAIAHGPTNELRLEVHAADGAAESRQCRRLALPLTRAVAMAHLHRFGSRSVPPARAWAHPGKEAGKANLPIRRLRAVGDLVTCEERF